MSTKTKQAEQREWLEDYIDLLDLTYLVTIEEIEIAANEVAKGAFKKQYEKERAIISIYKKWYYEADGIAYSLGKKLPKKIQKQSSHMFQLQEELGSWTKSFDA